MNQDQMEKGQAVPSDATGSQPLTPVYLVKSPAVSSGLAFNSSHPVGPKSMVREEVSPGVRCSMQTNEQTSTNRTW